MNNCPIIVDCPDEYLDILNVFFIFLSKNWPTRTNKIFVVTQEETIDCPENVEFVKCGKNLNSIQRTKQAIKLIDDDYFLIINCDDFICSPIDDDLIQKIVDHMKNNKVDYIRIWETPNKEHKKYPTQFDKKIFYCNKKARHSKSLMANFWSKKEYLSVFNDDKSDGWTVESNWLKEVFDSKDGYFENYCYYEKNPFHILHAVSKGKWIRKAYRKIIRSGIDKKLLSKREKLPIKTTLKMNIAYFLYDHMSSKSFYKFKKLFNRKKKFVSEY